MRPSEQRLYIRRHTGMSWLASTSIRKKALTLLLRPQKRHLPRAKGWISTFGTEPPRDSGSIYYNQHMAPIRIPR